MSTLRDDVARAIEYTVACALDDAKCYLTRGYAANDPEMREVVRTVIAAAKPQIERELIERLAQEAYSDDLMACTISHLPNDSGYREVNIEEHLDDWIRSHLLAEGGDK